MPKSTKESNVVAYVPDVEDRAVIKVIRRDKEGKCETLHQAEYAQISSTSAIVTKKAST